MKTWFVTLLTLMMTGLAAFTAGARPLEYATPGEMGMDQTQLLKVDSLILDAIHARQTPGAVLVVVRDSFIVYEKAWGWMQREPGLRDIDAGTIFDLASLTKPVATATAVIKLVENGQLRLVDPVSDYVPEFARFGGRELSWREQPRIIHLLTHTSGLPSYTSVSLLDDLFSDFARDSLMTFLCALPARPGPGTELLYSCPGFITLQKVVETVTGTDLATWTRKNIFKPLGMHDTFFLPDASLIDRIAPTVFNEKDGIVTGIVHDPLAREVMGGISGNAGLFSTSSDLALFAAMLLNNGAINGKRILSPAGVRVLTSAPAGLEFFGRTPGWDLSSSFASNQGDLFGKNTYGHTGYTGTSMVIDPDTRTAVILLTNRVYPDDSGSVLDLRAKVANVVAASVLK